MESGIVFPRKQPPAQGAFSSGQFFPFFFLSTSNRRQLLHHRRQFPSNRRWISSNRFWLPFQCCPVVCLNTELATGGPEFVLIQQRPASALGQGSRLFTRGRLK